MKIGFDAKRAYANDTGLGHYSRTLIASLAQFYPEHAYYLFTPKEGKLFNTNSRPQLHQVLPQSWLAKKMPGMWRSNWVTKDLVKMGVDLYHGLSHEIPVGIEKTRVKTVVTMHDLIHERYPEQYALTDRLIYTQKFRYACKHADKVIAISEQTKTDLVELYNTPAEKIEVCYQSCNPMYAVQLDAAGKDAIRKRYQLPEQYMLYVGSLIERKNLLGICKALHSLQGSLHMPLVVIGKGGKYKTEVEQCIAANNLQSQVIFLSYKKEILPNGYIAAEDFPGIYQMASMLIYPSIFEGFGIPVLEGLWSGVPVITSNISCLPEAGGAGAYYINPYKPEEIAAAMQLVLENSSLRTEKIALGLQHAQTFTTDKTAAAVMKVYEGVCGV
ncbi:MAG TPA: glycosyltransferase family 1 protein [Phnomibacter sp.]|nr:glycosyltransferase family 1 protein [Phnomibacter sp.]